MGNVILLVLLMVILIVPSIMLQRKQKRRFEEIKRVQDSLAMGDKVVTTAGIFGVVRGITAETVDLEISRGVNVTFEKIAIMKKVETSVEAAEEIAPRSAAEDQVGFTHPDVDIPERKPEN